MNKKRIRTTGCFLEYKDKFLILLRHRDKPHGNTWGLPAGKVEGGESDEITILREVEEETGYRADARELDFLGDFHFKFDDLYVEFPTYRIRLKKEINVNHSPDEHSSWRWVTPEECYDMQNLIYGLHELLERTGYIK